jgi:hypothetical protein
MRRRSYAPIISIRSPAVENKVGTNGMATGGSSRLSPASNVEPRVAIITAGILAAVLWLMVHSWVVPLARLWSVAWSLIAMLTRCESQLDFRCPPSTVRGSLGLPSRPYRGRGSYLDSVQIHPASPLPRARIRASRCTHFRVIHPPYTQPLMPVSMILTS